MVARTFAVLVAALVLSPAAAAASPPKGLHGFLLRSSENPSPHTFARTPSFAWSRVVGATSYEFQLSTSKSFSDTGIVWQSASIKAPLTTVPITLPWITGSPYSFYARVRARLGSRATGWSRSYGFNLRSPAAPSSLSEGNNPRPGLVRWTPVDGATAYEVTFIYNPANGDVKKIMTQTTAADLREYYTFHDDPAEFAPLGGVIWRVRAVRMVTGTPQNNLKVVSYGPWSQQSFTIEPDLTGVSAPIALGGTISRARGSAVVTSSLAPAKAHELIPAFWWSGNRNMTGTLGDCPANVAALGVTCPLYHVYVYTDRDCVNRVYSSDLVGSTAYAPRMTNPLELPADPGKLAEAAGVYLADGASSGEEAPVWDAGAEAVYAAGSDPTLPTDPTPVPEGKNPIRRSGIWDSNQVGGRYWWTVVPAVPRITPDNKVEYNDLEFSEDKCQAGQVMAFKKTSAVAPKGGSGVPYVSGQTLKGAVKPASSSRPSFYGRVIVAWKPAPGAARYEIQWSKSREPWKRAGRKITPETSAQLTLPAGRWYYRVRGLDQTIPSLVQGMTWSTPQSLRILPRTFTFGRLAAR